MSSAPGNREVAHRLFAAEFDDATLSYSESDEERAPNYVVTPTGARVNRLFAVGVLTEVEAVNEETLRGRVVDPTGAFVTYAGQYQPDEQTFLDRTEPPAFVALSGKARTFEPEDSDLVYTSVRPESINAVDAGTRDRWTVSAAEATLQRVAVFDAALESGLTGDALETALADAGVDPALAAGIPRAIDHYGTTRTYLEALRGVAVDALEMVAGEGEEVRTLTADPGAGGDAELGPLPAVDVDLSAPEATDTPGSAGETEESAEPATTGEPSTAGDEAVEEADEPAGGTAESDGSVAEEGVDTEADTVTDSDADADTGTEADADADAEPADDLGDFDDDDGSVQETVAGAEEELGDFDAGETVAEESALDEEERREVEEEFGTEFSTGSEVPDPGEADIDVPESEEDLEELADDIEDEEPEGDVEPETPTEPDTSTSADQEETEDEAEDEAEEAADEAAADAETAEEGAEAFEGDLEDAVVDAMTDLDDGDGADRDAVIGEVVERTGADPGDVEDAIQEALLGGRCYEPGDGTLKAI